MGLIMHRNTWQSQHLRSWSPASAVQQAGPCLQAAVGVPDDLDGRHVGAAAGRLALQERRLALVQVDLKLLLHIIGDVHDALHQAWGSENDSILQLHNDLLCDPGEGRTKQALASPHLR